VPTADEVDEPVTIVKARAPVYPPSLAAAGVSGEVRLAFVVDTAGHCEPGTIRVLASTQPAFEPPAIEAVLGTVYRPARAHGLRVRQLVSQSVAFRAN
jgi:TonB family protein